MMSLSYATISIPSSSPYRVNVSSLLFCWNIPLSTSCSTIHALLPFTVASVIFVPLSAISILCEPLVVTAAWILRCDIPSSGTTGISKVLLYVLVSFSLRV